MNEDESFQLQSLRKLVERLTTSGSSSLDTKQMKSLKNICKSSDNYVEQLFTLLIKQLKKKHAEIRFSAFQICHEIFMRSHCFRQLVSNNFNIIYNLTILLHKQSDILKPVQVAEKLKSSAISSVHIWYKKYASGYVYLKSGYQYLKEIENVDFEAATISSELDRQRRAEKLRKEEEIKNLKIQNILNDMESIDEDISKIMLEFNNTFKLLIPDLDNFFVVTNEETFEDHYTEDKTNEYCGSDQIEYGSTLLREHGIIKETTIQVNLSKIHELEETADNEIVISTLRELVSNIKNNFLPKVKRWEQSVMKYSATHRELTLKIIDMKRSFESMLRRYESVKIIPRLKKNAKDKAIKKNVKNNVSEILSSDEEDDFIDVPFDDPRVIQAAELEAAFLGVTTTSIKEKLKVPNISTEDLVAAGSSGVRHRKSNNLLKTPEKKKFDLNIDSFMDVNMEGPLKVCHSMPGLTNIWSGNEVLHDHGEDIVKPSEMLGIATRPIDFQREWEPVNWECRAPLPSGRLCPRKDRKRCPLHGPVIPRNNLGEPISAEDARRDQKRREEYERAHPEWQNPTLLAEIRAATGVDLDIKKAKKRKRRYPNLTNIREHENNSYNRLKKKIFSKTSVGRLNKALAKITE